MYLKGQIRKRSPWKPKVDARNKQLSRLISYSGVTPTYSACLRYKNQAYHTGCNDFSCQRAGLSYPKYLNITSQSNSYVATSAALYEQSLAKMYYCLSHWFVLKLLVETIWVSMCLPQTWGILLVLQTQHRKIHSYDFNHFSSVTSMT